MTRTAKVLAKSEETKMNGVNAVCWCETYDDSTLRMNYRPLDGRVSCDVVLSADKDGHIDFLPKFAPYSLAVLEDDFGGDVYSPVTVNGKPAVKTGTFAF